MRDTMKKLISVSLLAALSMTAIACGSDTGTEPKADGETGTEAVSTEAVETEDPFFAERVPVKDYGGATFTIYLRHDDQENNDVGDFIADEGSGDIVADAVYKRNLEISERFNVNFAYNFDDTMTSTYNTPGILAIRAGDHANDILAMHGAHLYYNALQGLFLDWSTYAKYNDFTAPWWDQGFVEKNAFAGKLYGVAGSISYTNIGGTFCIFFNKDICAKYDMEFPYQSVLDGKWTFDKFMEMSKTAVYDLNGDGKIEPTQDQYGLYTSSWRFPIGAFYMAGDSIITLDKEGKPSLTAYNERTNEILERMKEFVLSEGMCVRDIGAARYDGDLFRQERALFYADQMLHLVKYRDLDAEIGVVPFPKYDESIPTYYSLVDAGKSVFALPTTAANADLEMISVITEALAYLGYRDVIPAYYETALKTKYARDNESEQMLEIISDTRFVDYGFFDATINYDLSYIGRSLLSVNNNFTSYYEKIQKSTEKKLQAVYDAYLELD